MTSVIAPILTSISMTCCAASSVVIRRACFSCTLHSFLALKADVMRGAIKFYRLSQRTPACGVLRMLITGLTVVVATAAAFCAVAAYPGQFVNMLESTVAFSIIYIPV